MDFFVLLAIIVVFYVALLFFDFTLKSCSHYPYLMLMQKTGLSVGPFQLRWYTTSLNRLILKMSFWQPKFQTNWFTFGSWITICLIIPSICLVIVSSAQLCKKLFTEPTSEPSSNQQDTFLEPIVPGINLPMSDLSYYIFALMFSTVFHELGHALAAIREDMHVEGVGLMFILILPVAYVHLDDITSLPSSKQLRVMSAGVWHNIVQALMAYLVLLLLPYMLFPFFTVGHGVMTTKINQRSGVNGQGGLVTGDVITKLGNCDVHDFVSWINCLNHTKTSVDSGFCLSPEFVQHHDETKPVHYVDEYIINCCDPNSKTNLCFEYIESLSNPQELPNHSCLNVRKVIERSTSPCDADNQCSSAHCYYPAIRKNHKLVVIKRQKKNEVLFLGQPIELQYISVTQYVPKTDYLSNSVPESIEKFCKYLIMFAGGLAVINVIPCFYFDGEKISRVLVNTMLKEHVEHLSVRLAISICLTILGSLILIIYMILGFWSLIKIIN
ncbi:membrane-bound transcription factor site-2 protease [Rhopalosiphum maidis]|uniref:membrane-bound transcription factor site-2 protease n=1 Tax=Rhopalosiphum maidis TaxID=43146 RepID=UPI000EFEC07F|nr:membrane-bound transcription factor site-2 protease [Rhopalosiphum maidis]